MGNPIMGVSALVQKLGYGKIVGNKQMFNNGTKISAVTFANGKQGVYTYRKKGNELLQTIVVDGKTLTNKTQFGDRGGAIVNGRKVPQTYATSIIQDGGKVTYASGYTRSPIANMPTIENGKVHQTAGALEELHTSELKPMVFATETGLRKLNTVVSRDKLISSDGQSLPIFQRPLMQEAQNINLDPVHRSNTFLG